MRDMSFLLNEGGIDEGRGLVYCGRDILWSIQLMSIQVDTDLGLVKGYSFVRLRASRPSRF